MNNRPLPEVAFYGVSDARYFLGVVGMVNSLRLLGHREPIYLLDCGLTSEQRRLLAGEVVVVEAPKGRPPYLLKTIAPLRHPADVMVLIDADMIATRPLDGPISTAAEGKVVAFENDRQRFVPEWGEVLELGEPRRRRYVSSGFVALGGSLGEEVLRLLDDRQRRVDFERTFYGSDDPKYPFLYPEQDVLNAILCTRQEQEAILTLAHRLAPNQPFHGLRLLDPAALRCAYGDGTEPYVLHHYLYKPWLEPIYHGIYSRLLARLLLSDDVAVPVPEDHVPLRMRGGLRARIARARVDVPDLAGWYMRGLLPASVRAGLDARRRRRAAARRGESAVPS
jgi:hypothetical protein